MPIDLQRQQWLDNYLGTPLIVLPLPFVRPASHLLRRKHDLSTAKQIAFAKLVGAASLLLAGPALASLSPPPALKPSYVGLPNRKKLPETKERLEDERRLVLLEKRRFKTLRKKLKKLRARGRAKGQIYTRFHHALEALAGTKGRYAEQLDAWCEANSDDFMPYLV